VGAKQVAYPAGKRLSDRAFVGSANSHGDGLDAIEKLLVVGLGNFSLVSLKGCGFVAAADR
jgi:hypothetical protein